MVTAHEFQDAFISYGRADSKEFATQLHGRLIEQGFKVWFDQHDIPLGVDFQNQIDDGIEKAHNFLFLIAPHSINSPYCRKEIELALKRNKRIIPLLHVEQISQETWFQRNPNGTEADWEVYQSKGLHSSFPNMHPAIGKINWVYFREGIDDFDKSFAGLLSIFERHQDYVTRHTHLLASALEWERQQRQPRYLLTGDSRLKAEDWLKVRFKNEQPPCAPTDLHCEFVTESIKHANNLMTQVFLSHSEMDADVTEQVRYSLMRSGFTVWTNKTDIQTGVAFQESINRGIEEADNVVFLISPDSLQSVYCQQEIDYALALNKRIIPLLVRETDPAQIPASLRGLQYIDLTDNTVEADYQKDESQLLKILRQDAVYYEQHKILLVQALKWKQQQNPSLLLRGYHLQQFETWLKVGKQRSQHPPLPLQEAFISESLQQPTVGPLNVFIAYSRADSDFAHRLNDALQAQGKTTWFDQESIPSGVDFQQEIYRGIENSDTFLFIISPSSIQSPYCGDEVEYAQGLSKRIVTVLHQPIDPAELHPVLAAVQWIDFTHHGEDFSANFSELIHTLDTDQDHLRTHTRLLIRAIEWDRKDQDESFLLRGSDLATAEQWLATSGGKEPIPAELQQQYILSSRQAETARQEAEIKRQQAEIKRQRLWLGTVAAVSVVAVGAAIVAGRLYQQAEDNRKHAEENQFRAWINEAETLFSANDQLEAMTTALQVVQKTKTLSWLEPGIQPAARAVLREVLYGITEQNRLEGHTAEVWTVHYSLDGQTLVTASADGTARLWRKDGKLLQILKGHEGKVLDAAFSPDGKLVATASSDKTVQLWKLDGTPLMTLTGHEKAVRAVTFSPDGQTIATGSDDSTVRLWNRQGKLSKILKQHTKPVRCIRFSPDGELLATASSDKTVILWHKDGSLFKRLKGHTEAVNSVAFSVDGRWIATASADNTIRLWKRDGTPFQTKNALSHNGDVQTVSFSPDGQRLASGGADNVVNLWQFSNGRLLSSFKGHNDTVYEVSFSPDGQTLASASSDLTVRLLSLSSHLVKTLAEPTDSVYSLNFSPDGQQLAAGGNDGATVLWNSQGVWRGTRKEHVDRVSWVGFTLDRRLLSISDDGTLIVWDGKGQPVAQRQLAHSEVRKADISPDRQLLALATADKQVQLWTLQGKQLKALKGHQAGVRGIAFSPDGQMIASGDDQGTLILWQRNGTLLKQFQGHEGGIRSVSFSANGQLIATTGDDKLVRLWKRDGTLLQTLRGHTGIVRDAVFSPNSQIVASSSDDKTVILWKLDGTRLKTLKGHTGPVLRIRFSPDGMKLATGSGDNKVKLWELGASLQQGADLDDLVGKTCNWLQDYLQNNLQGEKYRSLCSPGPGAIAQANPGQNNPGQN